MELFKKKKKWHDEDSEPSPINSTKVEEARIILENLKKIKERDKDKKLNESNSDNE